MSYFIGADLGTSALKLLLTDRSGRILKEVSRTYPISFPAPGWSEQLPDDWWDAFISGTAELISGIDPKKVEAIGVGGQMHGLVILDSDGKVIRPAILWNDGRTGRETDYLNNVIGRQTLSDETGNVAFAGFTAPKLLWLRKNEPDSFARISKLMLPKDYITYRLTGRHCTDYSDASGTLLLDVRHRCWSERMLEICSVSRSIMPDLLESYDVAGRLLPSVADALGLSPETKVVAGAGDNAAAAIGTGTIGNGRCNISLGTSGTVFISSDTFSVDRFNSLHSFCHADGGYHLMGCILSAASCNKWFCGNILRTDDYPSEQAAITDGMLGNNHVFFLPYLMGERSPHCDTDARGTFIGLRMDSTRSDMLLAVLEGVAFAIGDCVEVARAQNINIQSSSICGGGARSELWLKIICNVLNIKISTVATEQGPGYGAAILAAVGADAFRSVDEAVSVLIKKDREFVPDPETSARYREKYNKFREIYPSVKDLFKIIK